VAAAWRRRQSTANGLGLNASYSCRGEADVDWIILHGMPGLVAITREVSPSIASCEVRFLERQPIDYATAVLQHRRYVECLTELGVFVITLPALPDLPDAVFVEDPAVVVDEAAILTRMGASSRRAESQSLAEALE